MLALVVMEVGVDATLVPTGRSILHESDVSRVRA
jgi:hypothetical protein